MGAWRERVEAVDLIKKIEVHMRNLKPDLLLIEKRASGHQVLQELKRRRWPVRAFLPKGPPGTRGKVPRAHGVAYMFEQGIVHYYPIHSSMAVTTPETVIDECAQFPQGMNDDLVDCVTSGLAFLRDKFFLQVPTDAPTDEEEDEREEREQTKAVKGRRLYSARPAEERSYAGRATARKR
jgi:phage terminase large subunit-like protein